MQEALEGFASGRFQIPAEVKRFLDDQPNFPKNKFGEVTHEQVMKILSRVIYAGYVKAPKWGISLRAGKHKPLISLQTYQRIQKRLGEGGKAAARPDISEDFPLRGFVSCAECEKPLTANWSTRSYLHKGC